MTLLALGSISSFSGFVLLLAGATLILYLAVAAGVRVLDPRGDRIGASAVAHWAPMAAVTLLNLRGNPQASVCVIFAASLASLTLVPAVALLTGLRGEAVPEANANAPDERRAWPMLLSAAMLVLLAGFRGSFALWHAVLFFGQGCAAVLLWSSGPSHRPTVQAEEPLPLRALLLTAWIALSIGGAFLVVLALTRLGGRYDQMPVEIIEAQIALVLVLPLIGTSLTMNRTDAPSTARAPHERMSASTRRMFSLCAGCVLLNLCVLLPLTIVARDVMTMWPQLALTDSPLSFPMIVWRLDTVLLVVLAAFLWPISSGRLVPRAFEAVLLLLVYVVFLVVTALQAAR